jgi:putative hydrolase of the HAD superfamily
MNRVRAVLLDALGTVLELEPPAPLLRAELQARFGLRVDAAEAERAMAAEMAYYRAHHGDGRDPQSLDGLRARCAEVVRAELGAPAAGLDAAELRAALLASLRFVPYPDVPAALARLRAAGRRLVVVSNWDCSLPAVLARVGLAEQVDGVVTSAELGASKPSREVFARALEIAGAEPDDAVHVGDSVREDVEGALASGIAAVLVVRRREEATATPPGVPVIGSLAELDEVACAAP